MPDLQNYRVIGIRPNGDQVEVTNGKTPERAVQIRQQLQDSCAFPNVIVEIDDSRPIRPRVESSAVAP